MVVPTYHLLHGRAGRERNFQNLGEGSGTSQKRGKEKEEEDWKQEPALAQPIGSIRQWGTILKDPSAVRTYHCSNKIDKKTERKKEEKSGKWGEHLERKRFL